MTAIGHDKLSTRRSLTVDGKRYDYFSIEAAQSVIGDVSRLPFSMKVLLENLLRNEDGRSVTKADIQAVANWLNDKGTAGYEIAYRPARVLMQDFTGVPAVVDLAAMRDAMVNLGGGFPTKYLKNVPTVKTYGSAIFRALRKHFGNRIPETIIEPGRGMVGNAGIIESEVVLISKKSNEDEVRWVYLDLGKFGGLAETMDESIRYPIRTPRDGDAMAPCVLAGPTCDSADVLYEKQPYELPVSLEIGDKVLIEGTGAYTTTYAAVAFNGFAPLKAYHI